MKLISTLLLLLGCTRADPGVAFQRFTSLVLSEVQEQCYLLVSDDEGSRLPMLEDNNKPIMELTYPEVDLTVLKRATFQCGVLFYYPNSEAGLFNNQTKKLWQSGLKVVIMVEARVFQDQSTLAALVEKAPPYAFLVTRLNEWFDEYVMVKVKDAKTMSPWLVKQQQVVKRMDSDPFQEFRGQIVTAQILEYFPYNSRDDQNPGFELETVQEVLDVMGAKLDKTFYTYEELLQKYEFGKTDLTFGSFYARRDSEWPDEPSLEFWNDRECILDRMEPVADDWGTLFRPFQLRTWLTLLGSLVAGLVFLWYARRKTMLVPEMKSGSSVLTAILGPLLCQSGSFNFSKVRSPTLRTFFGVYLICCLILSNGFIGTLMSLIVIPGEGDKLTTWQEVQGSDKLVSAQSYSLDIAKNMALELPRVNKILAFDNGTWRKLADRKTLFLGSELFFKSSLIVRPETSNDMASYYIVSECAASLMGAIYFRKPNKIKPAFDDVLIRLVESGIAGKIQRKWTEAAVTTSADRVNGLNMDNMWIVFALQAMVLASIVLIFVVEVMWTSAVKRHS